MTIFLKIILTVVAIYKLITYISINCRLVQNGQF